MVIKVSLAVCGDEGITSCVVLKVSLALCMYSSVFLVEPSCQTKVSTVGTEVRDVKFPLLYKTCSHQLFVTSSIVCPPHVK